MGALPAALLAHGRLSPLAPLLAGAFPSTPSHDERSRCRGRLSRLSGHARVEAFA